MDLNHDADEDRTLDVAADEDVAADDSDATVEAAAPAPVKRRQFRTAAMKSKLSEDEANRQGRIVRIAFEVMGRDVARAFLNETDEALGGRPLDVATASADGMKAVEAAIAARGAGEG